MSEPAVEELELVRRARQGELEAFETLVRRYQQPLFNYLFRMCGNRADAEELAQAALIRSWEALASFRGASSFKTWLFRIGMNLCYNHRQRRRPTEELEEQHPADSKAEPAEQHAQRVREQLVRGALGELPQDQRSALVLSVYEQLSYKEIAEAMGKSERAVDSLLVRAKANLRKALAPARSRGTI